MKKYTYFILLIIWIGIIIYNSSKTAVGSMETTHLLIDWIKKIFFNLDFFESNLFITLLRKMAHFIEYFVLGYLVINTYIMFIGKNNIIIPLMFCVLFAISDEVHQIFVDGRSFMVLDILIDSFGAFVAIKIKSSKRNKLL